MQGAAEGALNASTAHCLCTNASATEHVHVALLAAGAARCYKQAWHVVLLSARRSPHSSGSAAEGKVRDERTAWRPTERSPSLRCEGVRAWRTASCFYQLCRRLPWNCQWGFVATLCKPPPTEGAVVHDACTTLVRALQSRSRFPFEPLGSSAAFGPCQCVQERRLPNARDYNFSCWERACWVWVCVAMLVRVRVVRIRW